MKERVKIFMYPDYASALFLDDEGAETGDYTTVFIGEDIEINLSQIKGLKDWFIEWDTQTLWCTEHWTNDDWKAWWYRGYEIAKQVKTVLPDNIDLYYFSLTDKVWKCRPEDCDDGGLFDEGEPILI